MEPATFIFTGRSGSGKGTQARLIEQYLKEHDAAHHVFYLETGEHFREFIKRGDYSSTLSRRLYEKGELQPPFLAVHLWAHAFIERLTGKEHVLIDGTPRYLDEAKVLTSAMEFYRMRPFVIYLNVSRAFSETHLRSRGRADDARSGDIEKRLDWYEKSVVPTIDYLRTHPLYQFLDIDGERGIEEVHREIVSRLSL